MPGTTDTLLWVFPAAEPLAGLFAGVPADAGVAASAASFAVGLGVAGVAGTEPGAAGADAGLGLAALAPAAGPAGADAGLCLAALAAAELAALDAGPVAPDAGPVAPDAGPAASDCPLAGTDAGPGGADFGLADSGLAPVCPALGLVLATGALSGASAVCPVRAGASFEVCVERAAAAVLGLGLGPPEPAGLRSADSLSAGWPADLWPGLGGSPPAGLPRRSAIGSGGTPVADGACGADVGRDGN